MKNMNKILVLLLTVGIFFIGLTPAAAEEEAPAWFPLLEVGGAIIGIIATAITFKNYQGMKGGAVGEGFKFITIAVTLLTLGIIVRGAQEQLGLMSEFMGELVFELFIYIAVIAIAIASKKSYDMMK